MSEQPEPIIDQTLEQIAQRGGKRPPTMGGKQWFEKLHEDWIAHCDAAGMSDEIALSRERMDEALHWAKRHYERGR